MPRGSAPKPGRPPVPKAARPPARPSVRPSVKPSAQSPVQPQQGTNFFVSHGYLIGFVILVGALIVIVLIFKLYSRREVTPEKPSRHAIQEKPIDSEEDEVDLYFKPSKLLDAKDSLELAKRASHKSESAFALVEEGLQVDSIAADSYEQPQTSGVEEVAEITGKEEMEEAAVDLETSETISKAKKRRRSSSVGETLKRLWRPKKSKIDTKSRERIPEGSSTDVPHAELSDTLTTKVESSEGIKSRTTSGTEESLQDTSLTARQVSEGIDKISSQETLEDMSKDSPSFADAIAKPSVKFQEHLEEISIEKIDSSTERIIAEVQESVQEATTPDTLPPPETKRRKSSLADAINWIWKQDTATEEERKTLEDVTEKSDTEATGMEGIDSHETTEEPVEDFGDQLQKFVKTETPPYASPEPDMERRRSSLADTIDWLWNQTKPTKDESRPPDVIAQESDADVTSPVEIESPEIMKEPVEDFAEQVQDSARPETTADALAELVQTERRSIEEAYLPETTGPFEGLATQAEVTLAALSEAEVERRSIGKIDSRERALESAVVQAQESVQAETTTDALIEQETERRRSSLADAIDWLWRQGTATEEEPKILDILKEESGTADKQTKETESTEIINKPVEDSAEQIQDSVRPEPPADPLAEPQTERLSIEKMYLPDTTEGSVAGLATQAKITLAALSEAEVERRSIEKIDSRETPVQPAEVQIQEHIQAETTTDALIEQETKRRRSSLADAINWLWNRATATEEEPTQLEGILEESFESDVAAAKDVDSTETTKEAAEDEGEEVQESVQNETMRDDLQEPEKSSSILRTEGKITALADHEGRKDETAGPFEDILQEPAQRDIDEQDSETQLQRKRTKGRRASEPATSSQSTDITKTKRRRSSVGQTLRKLWNPKKFQMEIQLQEDLATISAQQGEISERADNEPHDSQIQLESMKEPTTDVEEQSKVFEIGSRKISTDDGIIDSRFPSGDLEQMSRRAFVVEPEPSRVQADIDKTSSRGILEDVSEYGPSLVYAVTKSSVKFDLEDIGIDKVESPETTLESMETEVQESVQYETTPDGLTKPETERRRSSLADAIDWLWNRATATEEEPTPLEAVPEESFESDVAAAEVVDLTETTKEPAEDEGKEVQEWVQVETMRDASHELEMSSSTLRKEDRISLLADHELRKDETAGASEVMTQEVVQEDIHKQDIETQLRGKPAKGRRASEPATSSRSTDIPKTKRRRSSVGQALRKLWNPKKFETESQLDSGTTLGQLDQSSEGTDNEPHDSQIHLESMKEPTTGAEVVSKVSETGSRKISTDDGIIDSRFPSGDLEQMSRRTSSVFEPEPPRVQADIDKTSSPGILKDLSDDRSSLINADVRSTVKLEVDLVDTGIDKVQSHETTLEFVETEVQESVQDETTPDTSLQQEAERKRSGLADTINWLWRKDTATEEEPKKLDIVSKDSDTDATRTKEMESTEIMKEAVEDFAEQVQDSVRPETTADTLAEPQTERRSMEEVYLPETTKGPVEGLPTQAETAIGAVSEAELERHKMEKIDSRERALKPSEIQMQESVQGKATADALVEKETERRRSSLEDEGERVQGSVQVETVQDAFHELERSSLIIRTKGKVSALADNERREEETTGPSKDIIQEPVQGDIHEKGIETQLQGRRAKERRASEPATSSQSTDVTKTKRRRSSVGQALRKLWNPKKFQIESPLQEDSATSSAHPGEISEGADNEPHDSQFQLESIKESSTDVVVGSKVFDTGIRMISTHDVLIDSGFPSVDLKQVSEITSTVLEPELPRVDDEFDKTSSRGIVQVACEDRPSLIYAVTKSSVKFDLEDTAIDKTESHETTLESVETEVQESIPDETTQDTLPETETERRRSSLVDAINWLWMQSKATEEEPKKLDIVEEDTDVTRTKEFDSTEIMKEADEDFAEQVQKSTRPQTATADALAEPQTERRSIEEVYLPETTEGPVEGLVTQVGVTLGASAEAEMERRSIEKIDSRESAVEPAEVQIQESIQAETTADALGEQEAERRRSSLADAIDWLWNRATATEEQPTPLEAVSEESFESDIAAAEVVDFTETTKEPAEDEGKEVQECVQVETMRDASHELEMSSSTLRKEDRISLLADHERREDETAGASEIMIQEVVQEDIHKQDIETQLRGKPAKGRRASEPATSSRSTDITKTKRRRSSVGQALRKLWNPKKFEAESQLEDSGTTLGQLDQSSEDADNEPHDSQIHLESMKEPTTDVEVVSKLSETGSRKISTDDGIIDSRFPSGVLTRVSQRTSSVFEPEPRRVQADIDKTSSPGILKDLSDDRSSLINADVRSTVKLEVDLEATGIDKVQSHETTLEFVETEVQESVQDETTPDTSLQQEAERRKSSLGDTINWLWRKDTATEEEPKKLDIVSQDSDTDATRTKEMESTEIMKEAVEDFAEQVQDSARPETTADALAELVQTERRSIEEAYLPETTGPFEGLATQAEVTLAALSEAEVERRSIGKLDSRATPVESAEVQVQESIQAETASDAYVEQEGERRRSSLADAINWLWNRATVTEEEPNPLEGILEESLESDVEAAKDVESTETTKEPAEDEGEQVQESIQDETTPDALTEPFASPSSHGTADSVTSLRDHDTEVSKNIIQEPAQGDIHEQDIETQSQGTLTKGRRASEPATSSRSTDTTKTKRRKSSVGQVLRKLWNPKKFLIDSQLEEDSATTSVQPGERSESVENELHDSEIHLDSARESKDLVLESGTTDIEGESRRMSITVGRITDSRPSSEDGRRASQRTSSTLEPRQFKDDTDKLTSREIWKDISDDRPLLTDADAKSSVKFLDELKDTHSQELPIRLVESNVQDNVQAETTQDALLEAETERRRSSFADAVNWLWKQGTAAEEPQTLENVKEEGHEMDAAVTKEVISPETTKSLVGDDEGKIQECVSIETTADVLPESETDDLLKSLIEPVEAGGQAETTPDALPEPATERRRSSLADPINWLWKQGTATEEEPKTLEDVTEETDAEATRMEGIDSHDTIKEPVEDLGEQAQESIQAETTTDALAETETERRRSSMADASNWLWNRTTPTEEETKTLEDVKEEPNMEAATIWEADSLESTKMPGEDEGEQVQDMEQAETILNALPEPETSSSILSAPEKSVSLSDHGYLPSEATGVSENIMQEPGQGDIHEQDDDTQSQEILSKGRRASEPATTSRSTDITKTKRRRSSVGQALRKLWNPKQFQIESQLEEASATTGSQPGERSESADTEEVSETEVEASLMMGSMVESTESIRSRTISVTQPPREDVSLIANEFDDEIDKTPSRGILKVMSKDRASLVDAVTKPSVKFQDDAENISIEKADSPEITMQAVEGLEAQAATTSDALPQQETERRRYSLAEAINWLWKQGTATEEEPKTLEDFTEESDAEATRVEEIESHETVDEHVQELGDQVHESVPVGTSPDGLAEPETGRRRSSLADAVNWLWKQGTATEEEPKTLEDVTEEGSETDAAAVGEVESTETTQERVEDLVTEIEENVQTETSSHDHFPEPEKSSSSHGTTERIPSLLDHDHQQRELAGALHTIHEPPQGDIKEEDTEKHSEGKLAKRRRASEPAPSSRSAAITKTKRRRSSVGQALIKLWNPKKAQTESRLEETSSTTSHQLGETSGSTENEPHDSEICLQSARETTVDVVLESSVSDTKAESRRSITVGRITDSRPSSEDARQADRRRSSILELQQSVDDTDKMTSRAISKDISDDRSLMADADAKSSVTFLDELKDTHSLESSIRPVEPDIQVIVQAETTPDALVEAETERRRSSLADAVNWLWKQGTAPEEEPKTLQDVIEESDTEGTREEEIDSHEITEEPVEDLGQQAHESIQAETTSDALAEPETERRRSSLADAINWLWKQGTATEEETKTLEDVTEEGPETDAAADGEVESTDTTREYVEDLVTEVGEIVQSETSSHDFPETEKSSSGVSTTERMTSLPDHENLQREIPGALNIMHESPQGDIKERDIEMHSEGKLAKGRRASEPPTTLRSSDITKTERRRSSVGQALRKLWNPKKFQISQSEEDSATTSTKPDQSSESVENKPHDSEMLLGSVKESTTGVVVGESLIEPSQEDTTPTTSQTGDVNDMTPSKVILKHIPEDRPSSHAVAKPSVRFLDYEMENTSTGKVESPETTVGAEAEVQGGVEAETTSVAWQESETKRQNVVEEDTSETTTEPLKAETELRNSVQGETTSDGLIEPEAERRRSSLADAINWLWKLGTAPEEEPKTLEDVTEETDAEATRMEGIDSHDIKEPIEDLGQQAQKRMQAETSQDGLGEPEIERRRSSLADAVNWLWKQGTATEEEPKTLEDVTEESDAEATRTKEIESTEIMEAVEDFGEHVQESIQAETTADALVEHATERRRSSLADAIDWLWRQGTATEEEPKTLEDITEEGPENDAAGVGEVELTDTTQEPAEDEGEQVQESVQDVTTPDVLTEPVASPSSHGTADSVTSLRDHDISEVSENIIQEPVQGDIHEQDVETLSQGTLTKGRRASEPATSSRSTDTTKTKRRRSSVGQALRKLWNPNTTSAQPGEHPETVENEPHDSESTKELTVDTVSECNVSETSIESRRMSTDGQIASCSSSGDTRYASERRTNSAIESVESQGSSSEKDSNTDMLHEEVSDNNDQMEEDSVAHSKGDIETTQDQAEPRGNEDNNDEG